MTERWKVGGVKTSSGEKTESFYYQKESGMRHKWGSNKWEIRIGCSMCYDKEQVIPHLQNENSAIISSFLCCSKKNSVELKIRYFEEYLWSVFVHAIKLQRGPKQHWNPTDIHCMDKHWSKILFKKLYFIVHRKEKVIQVWNDMNTSKLWWIFHFVWTTALMVLECSLFIRCRQTTNIL